MAEWKVGNHAEGKVIRGSNGLIENAIRTFQGLLRTLKQSFEREIGAKVPNEHPLMHWLCEHTAWQLTTRPKVQDGATPYMRVRGRQYDKRTVRFAERVLCKRPGDGPSAPKDKLDHRWQYGYVLGYRTVSHDYDVLDEATNTIVVARSIQRVPPSDRWRAECLERLTATPQAHHAEPQTPEVVFAPGAAGEQPTTRAARAVQRIKLQKRDFDPSVGGAGYTRGCLRCDSAIKLGWGHTSANHSKACVQRMEGELSKTPEGRRRLEAAKERIDAWTAQRGEELQEAGPRAEGEEGVDGSDAPPPTFPSSRTATEAGATARSPS